MADETSAAVMPEFADAAGLEALGAAGGRSASATRSHGDAKPEASSPAVPTWPPPPTPEPFKALVRQMDSIGSAVAALTLKMPITAEDDPKFVDEVAEGLWPLAFYYGAGSERPSVGMLWTYALASLLGLVAMKAARMKATAPAPADEGTRKVAE